MTRTCFLEKVQHDAVAQPLVQLREVKLVLVLVLRRPTDADADIVRSGVRIEWRARLGAGGGAMYGIGSGSWRLGSRQSARAMSIIVSRNGIVLGVRGEHERTHTHTRRSCVRVSECAAARVRV